LDNKLSLVTDIEKEGGKFIGGEVESRGSEISQSKQSKGVIFFRTYINLRFLLFPVIR